jgi:hypothetical protein
MILHLLDTTSFFVLFGHIPHFGNDFTIWHLCTCNIIITIITIVEHSIVMLGS